MRRLFNEYEAFTEEGSQLAQEINKALAPVLDKVKDSGASMRDVEYIAHSEINAMCALIVIKAAIRRDRAEVIAAIRNRELRGCNLEETGGELLRGTR